ncbi:MAG: DUF885 family protein [Sphingomonas sp.]|jgi:hypothetical protein|uniref:DUF885 family protein n=1 Tax=Sphingomonas sp. TaxID=28214 RepID=UPI003566426D
MTVSASRRAVVAGAAALLAMPHGAWAMAGEDARLRAVLDALPRRGDPRAGLAMLRDFDPARLSLPARLDLAAVREGLAVDDAIMQRFAVADPLRGYATAAPADRPAWFALLLRRRLGDVDIIAARRRLETARDQLLIRADRLLRKAGRDNGTTGARFSALFGDERWLYGDDEAGRDRAVADMNRMLAVRRRQVPLAFDTVPPWCLDVRAARVSRADEIAGKSGRRELPAPGRAGAYYVDLNEIRRRPSWTLPSVVAHELLPGHMIQLPIEVAADPHPLRLEYAPAFAEGWGVYAEQLAAAEGAYVDPMAELGYLHWLLFRVGRGLVDIAIHGDGWPVERARAQLVDWQGEPAYFAPFDRDLARIVAEPATRAAEALAWLAIADRAPRAMKSRKAFHRAMLAGGRKRMTLA